MPVPAPRRSSPPPSNSPFADIKERQKALLHSIPPPSSTAALHMNGYAATNGHANGDVTTRSKMRRRSSRKHNKRGSTSSSASLASSSSSSSSNGDNHSLDGNAVDGNRINGNGLTKVESASLHIPTRREYEEWKGLMKRVVDEWEIPRKVLHSSIGVLSVFLGYLPRPSELLARQVGSSL